MPLDTIISLGLIAASCFVEYDLVTKRCLGIQIIRYFLFLTYCDIVLVLEAYNVTALYGILSHCIPLSNPNLGAIVFITLAHRDKDGLIKSSFINLLIYSLIVCFNYDFFIFNFSLFY